MKVYTIEPRRLWLRGRTNKHSLSAKAGLARLLDLTDVVQLTTQEDYHWREVDWLRFHYLPFPDGNYVPDAIVTLATIFGKRNRRVLAYCTAGRNRSALFAALMWWAIQGNVTGKDALAHVRQIRPGALVNPAFAEYLLRLK